MIVLITCGCNSGSQDQTSIIYSGLAISDEIDRSWQKADVSEIESLLGQKLPMPTYLPSGYEIKEVYYFQEPNSNPQVTDIILLISDQPISWLRNEYTCRITFSIGWNSAGLGLKLPSAEYIQEINGKLEQKDNKYILWWESYGSPGSLGSTLKLTANQQFSKDELIKIAASTRANSN